MRNIEQARQTQRAVDAAFEPIRLPVGDATESNSDEAWAAWDQAIGATMIGIRNPAALLKVPGGYILPSAVVWVSASTATR